MSKIVSNRVGRVQPPSKEAVERIASRVRRDGLEDVAPDPERVEEICALIGVSVADKRRVFTEGTGGEDAKSLRILVHRRLVRWRYMVSKSAAHIVQRMGISSIQLSLTAAFLFALTAVFIYTNHMLYAASFLVVAGAVETIDAAAAKISLAARRDVYIDYMVDRLTDVFLFGVIATTFASTQPAIMWLSIGTLVCSLLSSYGRSQAEALRFTSKSTLNRGARLGCVFVGLVGTAGLHLIGISTLDLLMAGLSAALLVTIVTLVERFVSAIRSRPYIEVDTTEWDSESFIPRLMNVLGSDGSFAIIDGDTKGRDPVVAEIVYVDKYKDSRRVRIVRAG